MTMRMPPQMVRWTRRFARRIAVLTNQLVNKPRRARAATRRPAIVRAAAQEFAQRGYDAAGVDRIAAKARVNKAMLYYHYGSKLGLYLEVLRDMFRAVGARTRAIADGPGAAEDKLDAWILTIVEEAAARPWFPPIMLRELASGAAHIDGETFGMMNAVYRPSATSSCRDSVRARSARSIRCSPTSRSCRPF